MTLKGYRLLQAGFRLLFSDLPAESWMQRLVVLLRSSSDFLSRRTASLRAEIITAKRTVKANKNCWQRSTNVLIHCKQLLVSGGLLQGRRQPLNWEVEARSVLLLWKSLVFNTGNVLEHLGEVFCVPVATEEHLK